LHVIEIMRSPIVTRFGFAFLVIGACLGQPTVVAAEELDEIRGLRAEIDALRAESEARLAALERKLARLEERAGVTPVASPEDETAALRAAAEAAAAEREPAVPAPLESRDLNRLNPELSVTGDVAYLADSAVADRFEPRSLEIAFQANLDPFSYFKAIVDVEDFEEVAAEEAYVVWAGLPGGTRLKAGRFFQQVGRLNRFHLHGLPQADEPAALEALFGEEARLVGDGVSLGWVFPFAGGSLDLTTEAANASNEAAFSGADFDSLTGLLHLKGTWDVGAGNLAEVGLTAVGGSNGLGESSETYIGGLEALFRWAPPGRAKYRGFELGTEVFRVRRDAVDDRLRSWQGYLYGQVRLSRSWLAGARVDRTEDPLDPGVNRWSYNPYVTFWQSEFVRIRAQLQLLRGEEDLDDSERFFLQLTWSAGPHKHEAY
jgi:hypothetical protein